MRWVILNMSSAEEHKCMDKEAPEGRHRPAWGRQRALQCVAAAAATEPELSVVTMYRKLPFTKSLCLQKNFKTFCFNEKQQVLSLKMDKV